MTGNGPFVGATFGALIAAAIVIVVGVGVVVERRTHPALSIAQPPDRAGEAQTSPPVQRQGEGHADHGQQPPSRFSVPVRIIEGPVEAERTEQREQRAEKREADDLVAQQRAAAAAERGAEAAESQRRAAWWQVGLAAAGTLGLFYTLWLTRRSVKEAGRSADAAMAAVKVAERTAERQLRAYVGVAENAVSDIAVDRKPTVELTLKNFGQTPAYRLVI